MKRILAFLCVFFAALSAQAGLFDNKPQFLKAEQAFRFSAQMLAGQQLALDWQIADGYYLYKKEILLEAENGKIGAPQFPLAESYNDEFFGQVEIFHHDLRVQVPLLEMAKSTRLIVNYQGCTKGFCYPPEQQIVDLAQLAEQLESGVGAQSAVQNQPSFEQSNPQFLPEQQSLAQDLVQSQYAVFWFFLLGLGLAFTPCVLPMLPLLSAIVIGQNQRPNSWRALALSFSYVQGMALTYTLLGLVVAAIGLPLQQALQSAPVLIGLSLLFALLAASMFGCFNLQLPNSWQNKLHQLSQNQQSGALGGVFIMGMIAGLVASPCTSAPLSGALLYVAQSGDLLTGAFSLYLLALGMGLPLMLITIFGNKILPKSGAWLNRVKQLFGFILLLLPALLLQRVFPEYEIYFYGSWAAALLIWLICQLGKAWAGLLLSALLIVSAFYYQPILQFMRAQSAVENRQVLTNFQRVSSYQQLQQALVNNPKALAMLDLYADWCVACKEFEKYTFSDPSVQQSFENVLLLQVDMTKNTPENKELIEKLQVIGLPTIIFFNQQGQEIPNSRLTGFIHAQQFNQWLNQLFSATNP